MDVAVLVLLLAICQLFNNGITSATAFNCKNSLISDQWRETVLTLHNNFRRTLAKGDAVGEQNAVLKAAKDMMELSWDCNIEELAFEAAQKCPNPPTVPTAAQAGTDFGYALESVKVSGKQCNATTTAKTTITKWWKDGLKQQPDANLVQANKIFSEMAYSKTTNFACTYQLCQSTTMYLLCFYNRKAINPLYEEDADKTKVCTNCGANINCANGLCQPTFVPMNEEAAHNAIKEVQFDIIRRISIKELENTQLRAFHLNTLCPTCTKDFSDDFREIALYMNNYYRRLLATGWSKNTGGYAKPGVQMIELQYSKALEDAAKAEADMCKTTATAGPEGENFWTAQGGNNFQLSHEEAIKKAMESWWAPIETKVLGDNPTYTADIKSGTLKYAANMAFEQTTEIGCAAKTCTQQGLLVVDCRYNVKIADDDVIYTTGKTCSKCKDTQFTKCSALGGLCVKQP